MKQRRRRREEWRRLLAEWDASGESAIGFAGRIGISTQTLYRWRTAVEETARRPGVMALAKIVEVRASASPPDDRFELRLVGGRSVAVPKSFDEAALARLMRVVEAAS
jgi:transposase-like protein